MTQRGASIALVVWLALGCAQSAPPKPNTEADGGSGGEGGGAGRDGGADAGGAGAGVAGAGAGGSGAGGAGTGGDTGELACLRVPPRVFACAMSDGIPSDRSIEAHVELTGTVELRKPDSSDCFSSPTARWVGYLGQDPYKEGQTYVVRGDDSAMAIELTLGTGSDRPLLAIGQRVRVTLDSIPEPEFFDPNNIAISVRDDADGRILFWFADSVDGFDDLKLPPGFTASDADPLCSATVQCNGVSHRRSIALHDGEEEVTVKPGELANIGGIDALLIDNVETILKSGPEVCFDAGSSHSITLALFARDLISKCDWRLDELAHEVSDENWCKDDDDCREVRANVVGYHELFPRMIACVEDNACSDGDVGTCATNDQTEQLVEFTTTCVPPGWTEAYGACDGDDDAGAP